MSNKKPRPVNYFQVKHRDIRCKLYPDWFNTGKNINTMPDGNPFPYALYTDVIAHPIYWGNYLVLQDDKIIIYTYDNFKKEFEDVALHHCEGMTNEDNYGGAINECEEYDNGSLWVTNDEYDSQVNYCPFCGYKAKLQAIIQDYKREN
jgi:hypothetical protein